jgi:hypothetical protein
MEKTGIIALVIGFVLCALGGYAVWAFLLEFIAVVKGIVGIVIVLVGLILVLFGILMLRE